MKIIWREIVEGKGWKLISYGVRFGNLWIGWQITEIK